MEAARFLLLLRKAPTREQNSWSHGASATEGKFRDVLRLGSDHPSQLSEWKTAGSWHAWLRHWVARFQTRQTVQGLCQSQDKPNPESILPSIGFRSQELHPREQVRKIWTNLWCLWRDRAVDDAEKRDRVEWLGEQSKTNKREPIVKR